MSAAVKRLIGNFGAAEPGGRPNVAMAEEGDIGGKAQTVEPAMELPRDPSKSPKPHNESFLSSKS